MSIWVLHPLDVRIDTYRSSRGSFETSLSVRVTYEPTGDTVELSTENYLNFTQYQLREVALGQLQTKLLRDHPELTQYNDLNLGKEFTDHEPEKSA